MTAITSNRALVLSGRCCSMSVSWHNGASAPCWIHVSTGSGGSERRKAQAHAQTHCYLFCSSEKKKPKQHSSIKSMEKSKGWTHSTTVFQQACHPGPYLKCTEDHGSSSTDLHGFWVRPTLQLISFDVVVLIGCSAGIKSLAEHKKGWQNLTYGKQKQGLGMIKEDKDFAFAVAGQ